ncbi:MAG: EF-hand domain-containing protein, partial [Pseudomonadota bacterium]
RKLDHFFRIFDENSDGIITWDDFATKLANLRAPFHVGFGDRRLGELQRAMLAWWAELSHYSRDKYGAAVDRQDWFRWFWSVQQRLAPAQGPEELPAAARDVGIALFRLADRDGDGRKSRKEFCGWLSTWTRHLDIDPERALRRLSAGRDELTLTEVMHAGAVFKFAAFPSQADALFGLME